MTKLNVILNDKTILNFPYLAKLLKRYMLMVIIMPVLIASGSFYYYFSQNDIQTATSSFEYSLQGGNSPTAAISQLLGQEESRLTPEEILTVAMNPDFISGLAKRVIEDKGFQSLNLNSTRAKAAKTFNEIFGHCQQERSCILAVLRAKLPDFYSINFDKRFTHRYLLTIRTLDSKTSKILLRHVKAQVVESRRYNLTNYISRQEELTSKLIEKQNIGLNGVDVAGLTQEKRNAEVELRAISMRSNSSDLHLSEKKVRLDYMKGKLLAIKNRTTGKSRLAKNPENNVKVLVTRIEQLRTDIAAIEANSSRLDSGGNLSILRELREELRAKEKSLSVYGDISVFSDDVKGFKDDLRKNGRSLKIEFEVAKKQYEKRKKEHELLVLRRRVLEQKMKNIEIKIKKYAPEVSYLEKLNNKLVQLQLVKSTIVADISFSKDSDAFGRVKRVEKVKVVVFAFVFSLFSILALVLFRFMFDSKIYDTEELMATFDGLEIIGNTPEFE